MDNLINSLPDVYRKDKNSNNYKLLLLHEQRTAGFFRDVAAVQDTLDIYSCTGKTLDLYGEIYGQARGTLRDEQYRAVILQAMAKNLCETDANSIIDMLSIMFNAPPESFGLADTENMCEVELEDLPYSILQKIGVTSGQLSEMVKGLLPPGVRLAPLELDGTFEFSAINDNSDGDIKGFGNVAETTGGYFGLLEARESNISK